MLKGQHEKLCSRLGPLMLLGAARTCLAVGAALQVDLGWGRCSLRIPLRIFVFPKFHQITLKGLPSTRYHQRVLDLIWAGERRALRRLCGLPARTCHARSSRQDVESPTIASGCQRHCRVTFPHSDCAASEVLRMQSMALSQNAPEDAMPQTMSGWSKKAMRWY